MPKNKPSWKGVFFDLDGTLANTIPVLRAGYERLFKGHNQTATKDGFRELMATPPSEIPALLARQIRTSRLPRVLMEEFEEVIASGHLQAPEMPGALTVVETLAVAGIPIAVVTSSPRKLAEAWLELRGFSSYVREVVGGDDVLDGKPDPTPYLEAMRRLGCPSDHGAAVEDSPSGVRSARRAGLATWMFQADRDNPDLGALDTTPDIEAATAPLRGVIHRLDELLPALLDEKPQASPEAPDLTPWTRVGSDPMPPPLQLRQEFRVLVSDPVNSPSGDVKSRLESLRNTQGGPLGDASQHSAQVFTVSALDSQCANGAFVPWRWWTGQCMDGSLRQRLRLCCAFTLPMIHLEDGYVLGRRSVAQDRSPGSWEFGAELPINPSALAPDGRLMVSLATRDRLAVTFGIETEEAGEPTMVAAITDPRVPMVSIAYSLYHNWTEHQLQVAVARLHNPLYDSVVSIAAENLQPFLDSGEPVTEVTRSLIEMLHHRTPQRH